MLGGHARIYQEEASTIIVAKLYAEAVHVVLTPDKVAMPEVLADTIPHAVDLITVIGTRHKMCFGLHKYSCGPYRYHIYFRCLGSHSRRCHDFAWRYST